MFNSEIKEVFLQSRLFAGVEENLFGGVYNCLRGQLKNYYKDQVILGFEDKTDRMGIIIKGTVDFSIIQMDGSVALINRLTVGESIAEAFACSQQSVDVFEYRCLTDTQVAFLDIPKACTDKSSCSHVQKYLVMENMMKVMAESNIFLNKKIFILSQKRLRDKLLTYIKVSSSNKRKWISFNRQELANFINADRSAVSRELMRMKREGILEIDESKLKLR